MMELQKEKRKKILLEQADILSRHNLVFIVWDMFGSDSYPYPEFISENIRIYGYEVKEYLNLEVNWMDQIYEEDRVQIQQEFYQSMFGKRNHYVQKYRIIKKDGGMEWVEADSCIIRDDRGKPRYVETIIKNIQEAKQKERKLLDNQLTMQKEIFSYMKEGELLNGEDNLREFVREQKVELIQTAFSEMYGIHMAVIGRDYEFYTYMTGPKEEAGIFFDLGEKESFRKIIGQLQDILDSGQSNTILSMKRPNIKIFGVPITYKGESVATWVMCCLEERPTEEILRILQFMRVMGNVLSGYYSNHLGSISAKEYAFEQYKLQRRVFLQKEILDIFECLEAMDSKKEKAAFVLKKTAELSRVKRIAIYEAIPNTVYVRLVCDWMKEDFDKNEHEILSVKAMPNPADLIKKQQVAVINSIYVPKEWRSTFGDLHAKAAVVLAMEINRKPGFICFLEYQEERIWEEEAVWLFQEIKKIIEKVLLKSE